jgi:hypothetical protein
MYARPRDTVGRSDVANACLQRQPAYDIYTSMLCYQYPIIDTDATTHRDPTKVSCSWWNRQNHLLFKSIFNYFALYHERLIPTQHGRNRERTPTWLVHVRVRGVAEWLMQDESFRLRANRINKACFRIQRLGTWRSLRNHFLFA